MLGSVKLYRISTAEGKEIGTAEAPGPHLAVQEYADKVFGLGIEVDRITGEIFGPGYFWARFIGTDRYIGQPFKVEEIE